MSSEQEYDCPFEGCQRSFDSPAGVSSHHVQAHGESISAAEEEATCQGCGETFQYYPSEKKGIYCGDCVDSESWGEGGAESYERGDPEEFEKAYSEDIITGRDFDLSRERRGDVSEKAIEKKFLERDVSVLRPATDNEPYDLVVEKNDNYLKIQVKTGSLNPERGVVTVRMNRKHTNGSGTVTKQYEEDDVDLFAVCCPEIDKVFLLTRGEVQGDKIRLRVLPPKMNQPSINWARDYELGEVWTEELFDGSDSL